MDIPEPLAELVLDFSGSSRDGNLRVNVRFDGTDSGEADFAIPLTRQDREEIRWYVESYGAHSLADPDDEEAKRIVGRLPEIGQALFNAVFAGRAAQRVFDDFQRVEDARRLLTVDAGDAAVLGLPWELLHDPEGSWLFRERPHISVRRRISGATGGRSRYRFEPKERLHLLFVVSRPQGAGFIDPRSDPVAVLDAIQQHAPGRVTCEFLRPATLNALVERLDDDTKPSVDILHFDGHGVFREVTPKQTQANPEQFGKSIESEILRARELRAANGAVKTDADTPVGIGFLLFEQPPAHTEPGKPHLVSPADLAENLFRAKVGLVVLSACQTAALGEQGAVQGGDPLASVAGRLTTTGIPAILAMTHAVLAVTTRLLFAALYKSLARGRGIATALDDARVFLANNPEKFPVRRGDGWTQLTLQDWFLPALFQAGDDTALLTPDVGPASSRPDEAQSTKANLRPVGEAGFFGRRRELWDIERWFAVDGTRRISIGGFGGQGKTELALEAGRWLTRTVLFDAAVFVDYARVQGDPVGVAVSTLGAVLSESLTDADAATAALAGTPTLLILDNLEALSPEDRRALLDAAIPWSEAGGSRLLLTSRQPDLEHPGYRNQGTRVHRHIQLAGLGSVLAPDDALDWLTALTRLPPAPQLKPPQREELVDLFRRVDFHPLSIAVLAQQLKTRTPDELGLRLTEILHEPVPEGIVAEGTPRSLIASLQLSLDRLDDAQRAALRRLGVFEGGAMEDNLLAITGLRSDAGARRRLERLIAAYDAGDFRPLLLAMNARLPDGRGLPEDLPQDLRDRLQLDSEFQGRVAALRSKLISMPLLDGGDQWSDLRKQLEVGALITRETVPGFGVHFVRFHPTLALFFWAYLDAGEKAALADSHLQRYQAWARHCFALDRSEPEKARNAVLAELPNLISALKRAADTSDLRAARIYFDIVAFFKYFGFRSLAKEVSAKIARLCRDRGSKNWILYQSDLGEQLLAEGQADRAAAVFSDLLKGIGESPTPERFHALLHLARSQRSLGFAELAVANYLKAFEVVERFPKVDWVVQQLATLHSDLSVALADSGKLDEAWEHCRRSSDLYRRLGDSRRAAGLEFEFGSIALKMHRYQEASQRFSAAKEHFRRMREPSNEATCDHALGLLFDEMGELEKAEQHYREAARLREALGDRMAAAQTWNNLALLNRRFGKIEAAEAWLRKAISGMQNPPSGDRGATVMNNLADMLLEQPGRVEEARQLADDALRIKEAMDADCAQIWVTYGVLARIADIQSNPERADELRRKARASKSASSWVSHELRQLAPILLAVVRGARGDTAARAQAERFVAQRRQIGGEDAALGDAIERIMAGERDAEALCADLGQSAPFIEATLQALDDPGILDELLLGGSAPGAA